MRKHAGNSRSGHQKRWPLFSFLKRQPAALQELEKRYRLLFEHMTSGFALHEILCDDQGNPVDYRFLEINPAFEQLTGMKAAEIVGKTVLEVFPQTEDYWIKTYEIS